MSKVKEGKSEDRKRLWVVTELYYPENNQTGYYMTGIAEGLTEKYKVRVICGQPNYAARGTRAPKRDSHKGVEIERVWSTTLDKNVLGLRLVNMLTQGAAMFFKSLWNFKKNEDVLVVSAPPTLPFVTALAAKLRGASYTLVIQDKYPETLIAVGKLKADGIPAKFLQRLNVGLYAGAKKIIVVGRDMRELIDSQLPPTLPKTPIDVIQNWASLEEVKPLCRDDNPLLRELGLLDKFVFLYAGNMGHPQDIESIVECIKKFKEDERFHFLFIGSGVKRKWLEKEVRDGNLQNATILEPLPRSQQNLFLNACDVGLVPLIRGMRGLAMPSRTYNILAAGKPVLALTENDSEVAQVIEDDEVGWYVPPDKPDELRQMIEKIYTERHKIPEMQIRARKSALEKHSLESAREKYRKSI